MSAVFTPGQQKQIEQMIENAMREAMRSQAKISSEATASAMLHEITKNRRERYDKRLRNTKLLLRNYRMLKQHTEQAVYDADNTEADDAVDYYELMNSFSSEKAYIESISKSVKRTRVMLAHIDAMLDVYRIYCERSPRPELERHYRVIEAMYISAEPKDADAIAAAECIDRRTVYRDVDAAVEILTPLFFGVDGVKTDF